MLQKTTEYGGHAVAMCDSTQMGPFTPSYQSSVRLLGCIVIPTVKGGVKMIEVTPTHADITVTGCVLNQ